MNQQKAPRLIQEAIAGFPQDGPFKAKILELGANTNKNKIINKNEEENLSISSR